MPIYEYRCRDCGEQFEKLVLSSRADQVECENCGSSETEKLISSFATGGDIKSTSSVSSRNSCSSGGGYFT